MCHICHDVLSYLVGRKLKHTHCGSHHYYDSVTAVFKVEPEFKSIGGEGDHFKDFKVWLETDYAFESVTLKETFGTLFINLIKVRDK